MEEKQPDFLNKELQKQADKKDIQTLLKILQLEVLQDLRFYSALSIIKLYKTEEIHKLLLPEEVKLYIENLRVILGKKLQEIALEGDVESVKLLLKFGADPNFKDKDGTILYQIMIGKSDPKFLQIADLLIKEGAGLNTIGKAGRTLLSQLIYLLDYPSTIEKITKLLDAGANANALNEGTLDTPLHVLGDRFETQPKKQLSDKLLEVARLLLDKGADVNAVNVWGRTPLMLAAFWGTPSLIKLLLNSGADPDLRDQDGLTALETAQKKGKYANIEVVNLLKEAKNVVKNIS